jgi:Competence protein CoiA-like family
MEMGGVLGVMYGLAVDGNRILASAGVAARCPACQSDLIAKCGEIIIHHWAHRSGADCDEWFESEGGWHRAWKSLVPEQCREVIVEKEGKKHRADIMRPDGRVIELQHSAIGTKEIVEREQFYGRMLWLVDGREFGKRMAMRSRSYGLSFRWSRPRKTWAFAGKPVFIDLGDGDLFRMNRFYADGKAAGWGRMVEARVFVEWLQSPEEF